MLQIDDRLGSYRIGAAEPFIMSVQMRAMSGSGIIDWSARRLVLSFYESGQTLIHQIEGVYTNDPSGPFFAFVRDGRFSKGLLGKSVQVELAERLLDGKDIISIGSLTVNASSDGVASFGRIIGNIDARFTLYFDAIGQIALVEQDLLRFPGLPLTPAPIIDTRAGIGTDGTPMVGETFTGIDPVGNGPVVARRWIIGGETVSTDQTFTSAVAGPLTFAGDVKGPDGTTLTSSSTIMVIPRPAPAPTIRYGLSFDGPVDPGTTPRAFFSDPFFSDPFFRTGA